MALGVGGRTLTDEQKRSLDENGFFVYSPGPQYLEKLGIDVTAMREVLDRLIHEEGWRGGCEGKEEWVSPERQLDPGSHRLANLLDKHELFRRMITVPEILAAVHYVIKDEIKAGAVDMREPRSGSGYQRLHIDWIARANEAEAYDCVFVGFYLDDMRKDNGAIRVVPGTHKKTNWPDAHIDVNTPHPDEMQVEVPAGSFIVMNAHTWHGGAVNHTGGRRRTLYLDYRNRRLPQLLNQKKYLRPETLAGLNDFERYLLGVRDSDPTQAEDSLGPGAAYRAWLGKS